MSASHTTWIHLNKTEYKPESDYNNYTIYMPIHEHQIYSDKTLRNNLQYPPRAKYKNTCNFNCSHHLPLVIIVLTLYISSESQRQKHMYITYKVPSITCVSVVITSTHYFNKRPVFKIWNNNNNNNNNNNSILYLFMCWA
jgi:hypothetical protein